MKRQRKVDFQNGVRIEEPQLWAQCPLLRLANLALDDLFGSTPAVQRIPTSGRNGWKAVVLLFKGKLGKAVILSRNQLGEWHG
jgi:hypothetical protein